jgi:rRNA-processing protein FCF1
MKIILDTNFLIYCAKNKIDYKEEIGNLLNEGFELVVPEVVIKELKMISQKLKEKHSGFLKLKNPRFRKTTGKDREAASLALQLLDFNKVKIVNAEGISVDDAIINLANQDKKNIVCTLDREMRSILRRVILINKFKRLMLTR